MSNSGREIEAKFYVVHLDRILTRLHELQARLIQPRVLETNLRFDLPDGSLRSSGRVLRLRQDTEARLTFKGPGQSEGGVLNREEIEFVVEDHDRARKFIEALGYRKSMYYEKYRTTYEMEGVQVMLDELPYGSFVEFEGGSAEQVRSAAAMFGIHVDAMIPSSYTALFERLRKTMSLSFDELSFENFKSIAVTSTDLGVRAADE